MNASEKQKADFAAIRRKIIEPAVKELMEKDGWLIEWKPIKAGRKVTDIKFTFLKNPQQQLQFWGSKPEPPKIPSADQRGLSRARSMG
jgi:plasmid replication initiation protein